MTDITITHANVRPLVGAIIRRGTAGGTIEAGQPVYLDGSNGWKRGAGGAADTANIRGIMIAPENASSGDEIDIVLFGPVTGYSDLTLDAFIYVSDTTGEMITNTSPTYDKIVGWGESDQVIFVSCTPDGDAS